MEFNYIERILSYQDILEVHNKGNDRFTRSQNGNMLIKKEPIQVNKGTRIPIKEQFNIKENLPLPLSRTEVSDEEMNRLPYSAVVSLTMDGKFNGNGVLVGPRHILTCRHNLYNTIENKWIKNIDIVAGLKGTVGRFGHANVIAYSTFNVAPEDSDYDIALLIIDKPLGLVAGWMGMHAFGDGGDSKLLELDCHLTGFPYLKNDIYTQKGKIKKLYMQEIIQYEYHTERGNSGSPIWHKSEDEYFVVGVHIEGGDPYRNGCRLSLKKFEYLVQNKNPVFGKFSEIEAKGVIVSAEQKLEEEKRVWNSLL